MRLSQHEVEGIIEAIAEYIKNMSAELRLYGSRTDDKTKGGDVDLLLLVTTKKDKQELLMNKHKILANIKHKIGEQKIDLKIAINSEIDEDPFLQLIIPKSIALYTSKSRHKRQ